jgi:hypothetical protein
MDKSKLPDGAIIKEAGTIEDNLPMVNYIMLHRIYDMMTLIANHFDTEKATRMIEYHQEGYLLGPEPAFTPGEKA